MLGLGKKIKEKLADTLQRGESLQQIHETEQAIRASSNDETEPGGLFDTFDRQRRTHAKRWPKDAKSWRFPD